MTDGGTGPRGVRRHEPPCRALRFPPRKAPDLSRVPPAGRATKVERVGGVALRAGGGRPAADLTSATVPGSPRAPRACPGVSAGSWASPGPRVPPGRSLEGARRAAEGQPPSEWYRWHFHSVDGAGHPGVGKQRPLAAPAPQSGDVGKRRLL